MYIRFFLNAVVHTDMFCLEEITHGRHGRTDGGGGLGGVLLRPNVQAIILVHLQDYL